MPWQRARQPEQKRQRRSQILEAAFRLLEREGLDGVSLNGVAREAGLAKSNLYRYFDSLEEMLLALFLEELDRWAEALAAELGSRALQPEELAALLARTVAGQPRLAGLLARLAGVLERNLSLEGALAFKRALAGRAERIAGLLAEADPSLAGEPALRVVLALHGLVAGFWPMARPSAVVAEALERPDVRHLRVDFEPTLRDHLTAILHHVRGTGGAGAEETKGRSK